MKKVNIPEDFKKHVITSEIYRNGEQVILQFANGYGASVINHDVSFGLELAVLYKNNLCYSTDITSDVIGHLNQEELEMYLGRIKDL